MKETRKWRRTVKMKCVHCGGIVDRSNCVKKPICYTCRIYSIRKKAVERYWRNKEKKLSTVK